MTTETLQTESQDQSTQLTSLAESGVKIEHTMTTPTRIGKKPRPVWVASGNIYGLEEFFRNLGGKKFRGQWSFFNDPTDEILNELNTYGRKSFAEQIEYTLERKEAKADRYEAYAQNAEKRANSHHKRASDILSYIPSGQPILVGHHSEKRHRSDLKRVDSNMSKCVEESKKSEYFSNKSASLRHDVKHMAYSRKFIGNRIEEVKKDLAKLNRYLELTQKEENKQVYTLRINQQQEKLDFWQNQLKIAEQNLFEDASQVPSPETIKVGDEVYFHDWMPVVRVNKKTVTVSHWIGNNPASQNTILYTKIQKFRSK